MDLVNIPNTCPWQNAQSVRMLECKRGKIQPLARRTGQKSFECPGATNWGSVVHFFYLRGMNMREKDVSYQLCHHFRLLPPVLTWINTSLSDAGFPEGGASSLSFSNTLQLRYIEAPFTPPIHHHSCRQMSFIGTQTLSAPRRTVRFNALLLSLRSIFFIFSWKVLNLTVSPSTWTFVWIRPPSSLDVL